MMSNILWAGI